MAHPTDVAHERIEEMLAAYRELQAQFDRARDRLHRADEQKHTVNRRIFDRVRAEYDRELDAIRSRMSPLRAELDQWRTGLEAQLRETTALLEAGEEELAEAEFRRRVGEFGEAEYEAIRRNLDGRVATARAQHDEVRRALATLDSTRDPDATAGPAPSDAPAAQAPAAEVPAADTVTTPRTPVYESLTAAATPAPARPVLRAPDPAAAETSGFENPQDWIDEIGRDLTRRERRAPSPALAAATAPAPDRARATAVDAAPVPRAGMPSLVFVSGAHAGQSVAMLPTTLTIGREHDNNIEIKDADVARYHARIVHERGGYVVEDMDGSTGTWVNGQRTRRAALNHGDVIRVGQTEMAIDFDWTAGTN